MYYLHREKRCAEEECCPKRKNSKLNPTYQQL